MTNKNNADILNNVLESLIDSADGYEKAADLAERSLFKEFFTRRAASRRGMVTAIRDEISQLGGKPETDGTILANAHRVFMNLRTMVQDNDEAVIEAVENGEDYLRRKFDGALSNDDLTASTKSLLRNFQGELKADGRLIDHLEDTTS